jgi:hypothetical protein
MIVCYLRMLTRLFGVTLFMQIRGLPVRFSSFVVMCGGFVMIVFGHYGYHSAFHWPMPRAITAKVPY